MDPTLRASAESPVATSGGGVGSRPASLPRALTGASADVWDRLVSDVDSASMLVVIQGWLGPSVRRWHTAEDVWQDTLLEAWRDRTGFDWHGTAAFRRWLLTIAQHRIRDLAEHATALKRGGGRERRFADLRPVSTTSSAGDSHYAGPVAETSPDRVAMDRERADAMHTALAALPPDLAEVIRLRLFEELPLEQLAHRLGIGVEAVRYRFRKAGRMYRDALRCVGVPTSQPNSAARAD